MRKRTRSHLETLICSIYLSEDAQIRASNREKMKYLVLVSALVLRGITAAPLSAQENAASTTIEQESPNLAKRGQDRLEPIETLAPEFPKCKGSTRTEILHYRVKTRRLVQSR